MSRYSAKLQNGRTIVWGYDRPLSDYFLQELFSDEEMKEKVKNLGKDEDGEDEELCRTDEYVFAIGTDMCLTPHPDHPDRMRFSRTEILEFMANYLEIPEAHKQAVARDMPY